MLYETPIDHAPLALSFLWGCSLSRTWQIIRMNQTGEAAIAQLLYHIKDLRRYIPIVLLLAILMPTLTLIGAQPTRTIGVSAVVGLLCLTQLVLFQSRQATLSKKLREAVIDGTICGMNFSFESCPSVQFWFRATNKDWPKARLEVSIDQAPIPVKIIPAETLEKLGKVIYPAMDSPKMETILKEAKTYLTSEGITHPIDIDGWDQSQLTQDLIERMFSTQADPA